VARRRGESGELFCGEGDGWEYDGFGRWWVWGKRIAEAQLGEVVANECAGHRGSGFGINILLLEGGDASVLEVGIYAAGMIQP